MKASHDERRPVGTALKDSTLRGHPMYHDGVEWRFKDDDARTATTWRERPCGFCGQHNTDQGHDHCLGTLVGVMNACCGHGNPADAYVQLDDEIVVRGNDALRLINNLSRRAS